MSAERRTPSLAPRACAEGAPSWSLVAADCREGQARAHYGDAAIKTYSSTFKPMHYALCENTAKKPMAMKLVCAGEEELAIR